MSKSKPVTMRFETTKLRKAAKLKLDLTTIFRDKLDEILGLSKCPTCGSKLKTTETPDDGEDL